MLLNNNSKEPPCLKVYLNLDNLADLPDFSIWNGRRGKAAWTQLRANGFDGVQITDNNPVPDELDLPYCGLDRINSPSEADSVFRLHKERGDSCITLHVGWGIEDDDDTFRLVEAILNASARFDLPCFIETHRATITQDIWRTVQLTKKFPEILFNGDFSHYYCGLEMVYGDFHDKLDFMEPIFSRIGFMHGRIASPGSMQVPIQDSINKPFHAVGEVDYLEHFKEMWTRAMAGFLSNAGPGDVLIFAPELLKSDIYYARVFPDASGKLVEESDRYTQALLYQKIARECFNKANSLANPQF
ncbi:MAG: hypothetical protein AB3N63_11485 [Puniceicoccaceae bacterium]